MGQGTLPVKQILLFLLIMIAGIIVLQIYLSKKESKWVGLIFPFISFGISVMALLAVLLFSINIGSMVAIIWSAVYIFILCNIPTVILFAIYAACRGKQNRQRALEKMSIQDLE